MTGTWSTAILVAVWSAATSASSSSCSGSTRRSGSVPRCTSRWAGSVRSPFPDRRHRRVWAGLLIATGGILYTVGAVVYATGRPNPSPTYFGYHGSFTSS